MRHLTQLPRLPPSRPRHRSDVNLYEEQLPPNTLVVLSGRDVLMAASEVRARACLRCGTVAASALCLHTATSRGVAWLHHLLTLCCCC